MQQKSAATATVAVNPHNHFRKWENSQPLKIQVNRVTGKFNRIWDGKFLGIANSTQAQKQKLKDLILMIQIKQISLQIMMFDETGFSMGDNSATEVEFGCDLLVFNRKQI